MSPENEEEVIFKFNVVDMGGNTRAYESRSIKELRIKLAMEHQIFYPSVILMREWDKVLMEDSISDVAKFFSNPDGTPMNRGIHNKMPLAQQQQPQQQQHQQQQHQQQQQQQQQPQQQQHQQQQPQQHPYGVTFINNQQAVSSEIRHWSGLRIIECLAPHVDYEQHVDRAFERITELLPAEELGEKIHLWVRSVLQRTLTYEQLDVSKEHIKTMVRFFQGSGGRRVYNNNNNNDNNNNRRTRRRMNNDNDGRGFTTEWIFGAGSTLLHRAAFVGHMDILQLLVSPCGGGGVDVDVRDGDGGTALFEAAYCGHLEAARFLLKQGADAHITSPNGYTAVHAAAHRGHAHMVSLLLDECKVDVNCSNCNGNTPLHHAAKKGNFDVIEVLLKAGAYPEVFNIQGKCPFDLVNDKEHRKLLHQNYWPF